ncbi:helix-turn-helix transcriptional regulator [Streptomyces sp. NBC_01476]|uniref:helix-turn-helix domain-containing protein n=1 Tax=Streptomyces sp. NBC_01476 TaxID=2903881 RepID=UPI002E311040|nr:helix-turn-helix transcriptional regulator [Streptomyces sp. NBC_01476]
MDGTNALGEFLRARRELVRPEDVGIRSAGLRRVPGLRREEVAILAGISPDYYLRLEQGRDRNPSVQVLDALAAVLRLDADTSAYLIELARERSSRRPGPAPRKRTAARAERVPVSIRQLMDGWPANPAYVQNKFSDVLAVNALAAALSPNYAPGVNLLRAAFLDPADRELRRDWEEATQEGVASLRAHVGPDVDDPRLVELVGELSVRSDRFRQLWSRHDVRPKTGRVSRLTHPQVGDIDLLSDKLAIGGTDGLLLVVFHAEPGSRNAELLAILGSLNAQGAEGSPGTSAATATTPATPATPATPVGEDAERRAADEQ